MVLAAAVKIMFSSLFFAELTLISALLFLSLMPDSVRSNGSGFAAVCSQFSSMLFLVFEVVQSTCPMNVPVLSFSTT